MSAKVSYKSGLAIAVAMASGVLGTPAFAQEGLLEEVVVYAQKRGQSILEVPISVASYSADALDKAQVRDVGDLQQMDPSLSVNASSGGSESVFAIRGIGTAGNNAGLEQSVGVFIDGVYRGRPGSALSDYVDVESIEVLKGPQGTLFGRNTSAGVISVRTAKPSYETAGGIDVSAGDEGYFQTKAFAAGALVDDVLAYRVSASYQEKDGYIHDENLNKDYNDRDRYSLRGQLLWDIDDTKSLRVIADYSESNELCCAGVPVFQGPTGGIVEALGGGSLPGQSGTYAGVPGNYIDSFDRKTLTNAGVENNMEDWGVSGEFNWEFNNQTELTVIGAYRKFEDLAYNDADATAIDLLVQSKSQEITEKSLELRLASTGSQTVDWMAGFFYFDQDIDYSHPLYFGDDSRAYYDALFTANFGFPMISAIESEMGAPAGSYFASDDYTTTNTDYNSESMAIFGQATWNATDKLSVTLGLRYSEEEKTAKYRWDGDNPYADLSGSDIQSALTTALTPTYGPYAPLFAAGYTPFAQQLQIGARYDDFTSDYDDDNVSGTVSVNYMFSDELSTYARFAQGYKAGGLNMDRTAGGALGGDPTVDPSLPVFDPEEVSSYEIGLKSQWLDGRLQLNAALFYQTLEDFQANSFDGIAFVVRNAAEVEGKGLELDYAFRPNENWLFSGGLVLQDIEYSDYQDASPTQAQKNDDPTNLTLTQNLTGEPVVLTSDVNYSGVISYTTEIGSALQLTAGTSYSYRSEYFTAQDNDPISEQDAYWLFNLSVGLGAQDESWSVELWSKNVTDEEVYNIVYDAFSQANTYNAWVNEGRTFGITGRMRF